MTKKNDIIHTQNNLKNPKKNKKICGPVENLEDYVHPEWWRNIFNPLYLKTDSDVVDDRDITKEEVKLFSNILSLTPDQKILDLCCGQGRHSLEWTRQGYSAEGLDRSHYLIHKARTQAKKEGLNVKFREGDARKIPYQTDYFDIVVILGNSFGYFETMQDDLRVLKEVYRVLKPWGKLLIDVADGEYLKNNFQPHSWEWIDKNFFVCRERSLSCDNNQMISRELITNIEKGVIADQFYSERLYTKESLLELLQKARFQDINPHSQITVNSKRNQDLGMMERRVILTGTVKKEWTPLKIQSKEIVKNVVVLFGDPNKPDALKPDSVFDDDDFYTIDQLKSALRELEGYKISYFNDHDLLINDLMKNRYKIDYIFNLCDEGYDNDPKKELNVPAFLQMLNIPFTGSGPQCLAYCYDKSLIRGIAKEMEIPAPDAFFIKPEDSTFELPFAFPVIVKPNFGDSSFGITQRSVANNLDALIKAINEIREKFGYEKPVIVEEFLPGKDLSLGIIGNPPESYKILPVIEEDYSALPESLPKICGYEAKWIPDSPYWKIRSVPADISEEAKNTIIECSLKLFERLECRDYCRFDWRLDDKGNPKLLEVNPNPGWCWDGHLAKMAKIDKINYTEMIRMILRSAEKRLGVDTTDDFKTNGKKDPVKKTKIKSDHPDK
ncbi:MAG: methyltransferase domain-containing protein [Spirochaetes bacterium]|nr:methyltransferase domain-containing protein [Spirochaetota bacterium]